MWWKKKSKKMTMRIIEGLDPGKGVILYHKRRILYGCPNVLEIFDEENLVLLCSFPMNGMQVILAYGDQVLMFQLDTLYIATLDVDKGIISKPKRIYSDPLWSREHIPLFMDSRHVLIWQSRK
eukprot:TRINITY_DN9538_c0_g1_i2.p1 TRINITY_DN9538_c0_g1~~TRINITY_DN9538_c0_g1_i2.p1  ORF type:complete len:123 (-),score=22.84 TRINITY_DN9538_c0_g1_i2:84-452(-)